ncbi:MAG: extracellular solute-binding protein [Hyphomicrobiaceae bacterium]
MSSPNLPIGPERNPMPTRRTVLMIALAAGVGATFGPAIAQGPSASIRRHAIAKIGEPGVPADFKHFDWVNPAAPKGGSVTLSSVGNFDTLNGYTFKGLPAPAITLLDATLMAASPDEPATSYGLIAEWIAVPADRSSATFGLRANARFSDGRPITPEDVMFSLAEQKRAHPAIALNYKDITAAEKTGEREVTFRFSRKGSRELPYLASLVSVIPKHYWTGTDAKGEKRDLTRTTLEPPVGSGAYRVKSVDNGRSIVYERVPDWWGKDLPVNVGQYNFDEIRYLAFRDDVPEFEALKGGEVELREENSSRKWAKEYDFAAIKDGRLKKLTLPTKNVAQLQGFILNTRRQKFTDPRVRRAFALAYDFESANKTLFYGQYRRINSLFDNSPLAATGLPTGRELALLEALRDKVPPEVFTTPYRAPVNATADDLRRNLREAQKLLEEAGWKAVGTQLKNVKTGEAMAVEYLADDQQFNRIVLPYKQNLAKLGIALEIRVVDAARYHDRTKTYDYEMITASFLQSHAPGAEQREYWGSEAADQPAGRNYAGIKNPAIDSLTETLIFADSKDEMIAAARALDRVVLWNHYIMPQWYNPDVWYAHWDKFGRPARHPAIDPSPLTTWWVDQAAAQRLGGVRGR